MHGAFGTVLWVVCIVAAIAAVAALISTNKSWQEYGKNGLLLDSEMNRSPTTASPSTDREREEEIRQMMEARNARRARRGEPPLDVDREIARLSPPPKLDAQLQAEIRDLVKARNYRRVRAGKPPLDVEAEIQRQVEKLRGL